MKGIWTTNKNDVIQDIYKDMEKIACISSDQIIGARVLKDFPENTLKYFRPYYLKVKRKLNPIYYDSIPVLTPAGRQSYQSGWLIPKIKEGFFDGMICTVDDITERERIKEELNKSEYKLKERVKELNCLYKLSKLIEISDVAIEEVIEKALNLIPPAWQFPEITCARIFYEEKEFKTENFVKTKWVQKAIIKESEKTVGAVEVYYLKKMPKIDGSLFLNEERSLINAFAKILGSFFERRKAELSLKRLNIELEQKIQERTKELIQSQERYKELFDNMSSGVAVYEAINEGEDFILKDFNLAGERIDNRRKEDLFGKKVTKIFPGVKEFGVFEVFQRVWKTGKPEKHPISQYKDNRIIGWREIYVYKLPSGEIVEVYDNITEKIIAQNNLKESEEKYHFLYDNISVGIGTATLDGKVISMNKALKEILGYSVEELNEIGILSIYIDPSEINKFFSVLQKDSLVREYEVRLRRKNGSKLIALMNADIVELNNEKLIHTSIRDITNEKEKEEAIRLQSQIMVNLSEGVYLIRLEDGIIVYANPRFEEMFGYELGEMIGMEASIINAPTDKTPWETKEEIIGILLETGEWHGEVKNIKEDGSQFWCYANVTLFDHPMHGRVIVSIYTNITERKKTLQKLIESEEKFRAISEQTLIGIAILHNDRFRYVNKQFADIFGYTPEEMKNWEKFEYKKLFHPDDKEMVLEQARKKQLGLSNVIKHYQFRGITKIGETNWLEIYSNSMILNNESADLISIVDIKEKKEAEKIIINQVRRLTELNQMKTDLINRISHELKTPLNAIFGSIQLLMDDFKKDSEADKYRLAEVIYKGGNRLKKIINDLVEISQFELKKIKLKKKIENINNIIKECIEELIFLANKKKIFFSVDLGEDIFFQLDRFRFEQVIINIISNAINNTPTEGRVNIKLNDNSKYLDISIKDTGIGLTEEEKEKLFTKFGKIERYGKGLDVDINGWGLGLYISKEIMQLHEGKILVKSEGRNQGAEFIIRLFKTV